MKKYKTLFFLIFITSANTVNARNPDKIWALGHPFAAFKVKKIKVACDLIYNNRLLSNQLDSFGNGGKLDAFRHVFYMAAFAQKIKIKKLRKLGKAHEKKNYQQFLKGELEDAERPDSLGSVMDLKNNELAFVLGKLNKIDSLEELKNKVVSEINSGNALIVKRNKKGSYVTCQNEVLDLRNYLKQWHVPKCLVPSNYMAID